MTFDDDISVDVPVDLPVIGPSEDGLPADLPPRLPRSSARQCLSRFGHELASDWTWAVLLIAAAGVATAGAVVFAMTQGTYAGQRQYTEAKAVAKQLEADGMQVSLGSYEDGLAPDGCCVMGKVGQGTVKLDLAKNGKASMVTYRVRIDDMRKVDADSIATSLTSLANSLNKAGVEISLSADQLPVDAAKVAKGFRKQSIDSKRVKAGKIDLERIYRYESFKDYGVLDVTVRKPPADVSGSKTQEKASTKSKRKKTAIWAHSGALQGYVDRHRHYL